MLGFKNFHCIFSLEKALEAITICGEIESRERFAPIIQGLETRNETLRVRNFVYVTFFNLLFAAGFKFCLRLIRWRAK